jgi:hypothetical protein
VPRFQLWHELAILALIGMEITWVAMWFRIFSRTAQPISFWRSLAVFAGMSIGVFAFAQLLNLLRIRQNLRRGALAVLFIGSLLLGLKWLLYPAQGVEAGEMLRQVIQKFTQPDGSIPAEYASILALLWLGWRGIYLAGREVESSLVRNSFYMGIGMFFIYGLITPATGERLVAPLYLFLFFWLSAASAARLYRLIRYGRGRVASVNRRWLASVLVAVLGVVGTAALAGGLMSWKLAALISLLLGWLVRAVMLIGSLLLIPIILLLAILEPFLQNWLKDIPLVFQRFSEAMQQWEKMAEVLQKAAPQELFTLPPFVRSVFLWASWGLCSCLPCGRCRNGI